MTEELRQLSFSLASRNADSRDESAHELGFQLERILHNRTEFPTKLLGEILARLQNAIERESDPSALNSLLFALYAGVSLLQKKGKNPDLLWIKLLLSRHDDEADSVFFEVLGLDDQDWSREVLAAALTSRIESVVEEAKEAMSQRNRR